MIACRERGIERLVGVRDGCPRIDVSGRAVLFGDACERYCLGVQFAIPLSEGGHLAGGASRAASGAGAGAERCASGLGLGR